MRASNNPRTLRPPPPLPIGTRIGSFELRSVLGLGQYGYGYRVWDTETEVEYVVKEYLPPALARREGASAIVPRRPEDAEAFAQGRRAFLVEGQMLAQVRHESLVHVYGSWEENGSAYMAMDPVPGRDLRATMQARGRAPREASLRGLLNELLGAVDALHRAGVEHRDIGLSSIVIGPDHRAVLMDLGSPRRLAIVRGASGDAGPREGFAPVEMYDSGRSLPRGPWTDLYALGAVMYCLMTGKPPPPAPQRAGDSKAADLRWTARLRRHYALEWLALVQWLLAPQPQDRPQDVSAVYAALADPRRLPDALRPRRRERVALALQPYRRWLWGLLALLILLALAFATWRLWQAGRLPGFAPPPRW